MKLNIYEKFCKNIESSNNVVHFCNEPDLFKSISLSNTFSHRNINYSDTNIYFVDTSVDCIDTSIYFVERTINYLSYTLQNMLGSLQNTLGFLQNTHGSLKNTLGFLQNTLGSLQNINNKIIIPTFEGMQTSLYKWLSRKTKNYKRLLASFAGSKKKSGLYRVRQINKRKIEIKIY